MPQHRSRTNASGRIENRTKAAGYAGAPEAVELHREQMIQQIVAGCDLCEHLADLARGVVFRARAFGAGPFWRGGDGFGHRRPIHFESDFVENCGAKCRTRCTASSGTSSYEAALPRRGERTKRSLP